MSRPIRRGEGTVLSRVQYARYLEVVSSLGEEEWAAPTDCPGWTVKDVTAHVLGNLECVAKPREFLRQVSEGKKLDPEHPYDGLNAYQVSYYAGLSPAELVQRIATIAEPALRMRARTPWLLRHLVRPSLDVVGRVPMAYVLDTIYTRDTYLHRVDVCRATGRDVVLDDVEQRIVEDIVAEWAGRHGQPYRLTLTGPAGGTYAADAGASGEQPEEIVCDAVEFTRLVSGRGTASGLLATRVQF